MILSKTAFKGRDVNVFTKRLRVHSASGVEPNRCDFITPFGAVVAQGRFARIFMNSVQSASTEELTGGVEFMFEEHAWCKDRLIRYGSRVPGDVR